MHGVEKLGRKRLLFIVNDLSFFFSHRLPIALEAAKQHFEVHIATPPSSISFNAYNEQLIFHTIHLYRKDKNPIKEIKSLISIYRLLKDIRPDIVHLVTIKPVLYGGLLARITKVPSVVMAIPGLGSQYIAYTLWARFQQKIINQFYRVVLKHPNLKVIFQNRDDRKILLKEGALSIDKSVLVRGSGVDLTTYRPLPEQPGEIVIALITRLLKDKGVLEYVTAVTQLKNSGVKARFLLVGEPDYGNPAFIGEPLLDRWRKEGYVELLGFRNDIPDLMQQIHIVVLPSYREGLPKVLLEAAACGKAVITTDVPGCRDAIIPEKTGLLVPVKDSKSLAAAMQKLITNSDLRQQLGKRGRVLAEAEFAIEYIIEAHINIYKELCQRNN
jgi:glycosyltransferase involved in cell wall biosynthesis